MADYPARRDGGLPANIDASGLDRYGQGIKGGKEIVEEAKRQALAEILIAEKGRLGRKLIQRLGDEAAYDEQESTYQVTESADKYSGSRAYDRIRRQTEELQDQTHANVQRIIDDAAYGIVREVHKPVYEKKDRKGLFGR